MARKSKYSQADIDRAIALAKQHGRGGAAFAARLMKIPQAVVYRWIKDARDGKQPAVAKAVISSLKDLPEGNELIAAQSQARVYWSDEELQLLAIGIAEERVKDPIPSLTTILTTVQKQLLAEDRRRDIASITQNEKLLDLVLKELEAIKHRQVQEIPLVIPVPAEIKNVELLSRLTDAELFSEVGNRIADLLGMFKLQVNRELMSAFGTIPQSRTLVVDHQEAKEKKIKICIIGPLETQFRHVAEKCKSFTEFEYVFLDKDRKTDLPPLTADWVIVQSRFMSHSKIAELKAISALRDRLIELDPSVGINGICKAIADLHAKKGMEKHG